LAQVDFPSPDLDAPKSKYVVSVRIVSGAVAIDYGRSANQLIAGKELVLVPGLTESQELVWICGHAPPPVGVVMAFDSYQKLTGIADKFLPLACRAPR